MGVFLPFLRAHTEINSPDQEPWSWGEPYLSINRRYVELRYRLLSYLYTALWQCTQTGLPIVRPLLLAFQDDAATHALDDQFLCGDAFLVAPVIEEGATRRTVYLPAGVWYDFWTDEPLDGPAHIEVQAPLERLPLFVRAGAVVPMGPPMQYVGERPMDRLTLHIYPSLPSPSQGEGTEVGVSLLYEDDGRTWAFQDGECRITRFTLSTDGPPLSRLDLRRQIEGCYEPGYRDFEIVIHGVDRLPHSTIADGQPIEQCELDDSGRAIRLHVGPFKRLTVEWA